MLEISFDVMQSAAIAALVALVGRAIVKRVKFFQTYCVPGVVVAGLLVSIVLGILRASNVLQVDFDVAVLKEWFMDIFFTGVGLTASWKLIKSGGKVCIGIAVATIGLILWQDVLGVVLSMALGMHPLQGLGLGSLSLMAAWAPPAPSPPPMSSGRRERHGSGHYVRHLRHGVRQPDRRPCGPRSDQAPSPAR